MSKISSFANLYPEMAKEWHPTKNGNLTTSDVKSKSNKKAWWLCPKGHEYQSKILSRAYGSGCAYCDGKKTAPERSLARVNPKLAKEWHPTKNGDLEPIDVMPGSTRKVWWQCSDSHEWQALIGNRHLHNARCPYCAKKKAHPLYCLGNNNPEIAKEWHPTKNTPLTPYGVTPGSDKKAWWLCPKGHEYEARVYSRLHGHGCSYCDGKKTDPERSLAKVNPELAKEWHPTKNGNLKPDDVTPVSGRKVWWLCSYGHEWQCKISGRKTHDGMRRCPRCWSPSSDAEYRIASELLLFFQDVKQNERKLFDGTEADIFIPSLNLIIEIDGGHWHGDKEINDKKKNTFFIERGYTIIRLRGKPLKLLSKDDISFDCSNTKISDIVKLLKKILHKHYVELNTDTINKIEKYIANKHTKFQNEEEYLRIRKALPGKLNNSNLLYANPELVKKWHPTKNGNLKPEQYTINSGIKIWWQCLKNPSHEWYRRIADAKGGCQFCSGKRASPEHCLATNNPELAKEWHPTKNGELTPDYVTPRSNEKVWWICSNDHEWQAKIDARNGHKTGCPECAKRKVGIDNNLQKLNPEIAKEWHLTKNNDLTPLDVMPNSKKKVWWQCNKDASHEYQMIVGSKTGGYKCPICSGRKVDETTCLAIKNPELAKEWHKIKNEKTPHDFTTGSKFKAWWICPKCKHEYQSLILTRSHGHGCPACSNKAKKERAIKRWTKYREDKLNRI